jgi:hypothetical protein
VAEQADRFAARVLHIAGSSLEQQVREAVERSFGRAATSTEIAEAVEFLKGRAGHYRAMKRPAPVPEHAALIDFCHVLFNSNEFAYVD